MDASTPDPLGVVLCNPFKWDILCSFLLENLVIIFVCATTANQISFRNHRYRKVVVVEHNVVLLYVDANAPDPSGVVLWNPFKWDILCSFLIKNHTVVSVPSTAVKWISFCNHRNRKVVEGRRQTQCSSTLFGCLCSWPIWCCSLQPSQIRYFVFISDQKSCFFLVCLPQKRNEFYYSTTTTKNW